MPFSKRSKITKPSKLSRHKSRLIPSVLRSRSGKRKKSKSSRQHSNESSKKSDRTTHSSSPVYMNILPSFVVDKYLKKGTGSSSTSKSRAAPRSSLAQEEHSTPDSWRSPPMNPSYIDGNRMIKSDTCDNLQVKLGTMSHRNTTKKSIYTVTLHAHRQYDPCNEITSRKSSRFNDRYELDTVRTRLWTHGHIDNDGGDCSSGDLQSNYFGSSSSHGSLDSSSSSNSDFETVFFYDTDEELKWESLDFGTDSDDTDGDIGGGIISSPFSFLKKPYPLVRTKKILRTL